MKREVDYHEVEIRFVVTHREVKRITSGEKNRLATLAMMLRIALVGKDVNGLDAEDVVVKIDGRTV